MNPPIGDRVRVAERLNPVRHLFDRASRWANEQAAFRHRIPIRGRIALFGAAVVALTAVGLDLGFASIRDVEPSQPATHLWNFIFSILLAGWIIEDSRNRANIYRPFCFGFLLWTFVLPYAPYYLIRTRGAAGLLWIAGGVVLFFAGLFAPLLVSGAS